MRCRNCGFQTDEKILYCPNCGSQIELNETSSVEAQFEQSGGQGMHQGANDISGDYGNTDEFRIALQQRQQFENENRESINKAEHKKKMIIGITMASVIIVTIVILIITHLVQKNGYKDVLEWERDCINNRTANTYECYILSGGMREGELLYNIDKITDDLEENQFDSLYDELDGKFGENWRVNYRIVKSYYVDSKYAGRDSEEFQIVVSKMRQEYVQGLEKWRDDHKEAFLGEKAGMQVLTYINDKIEDAFKMKINMGCKVRVEWTIMGPKGEYQDISSEELYYIDGEWVNWYMSGVKRFLRKALYS